MTGGPRVAVLDTSAIVRAKIKAELPLARQWEFCEGLKKMVRAGHICC